MITAYIGLGSNLGNCRENLLQAWARLGAVKGVKLLELSSPYRSEPVGMASENWFINAVGSLQTSLPPAALLGAMLAVETSLGRKRSHGKTPDDRSIDLDLLYWGDRISTDPSLILPHPEIANRLFVLLPLAEIGPEVRHPVLKKTSVEMLQDLMAEQQNMDFTAQVEKSFWNSENNEVSA
jgi:2-amino-4-hydroxy-6-hydroxymethyldihydropteridine diphosphokinase